MTPLRVLHVTPYFAPAFVYGGPPRSILGLCKALRAIGVDAEVVTTTANGPGAELPAVTASPVLVDRIPVRYFPLTAPRSVWNAAGLRAALARDVTAFDVIHIHGLWHIPAWQAARMARGARRPYVVSPRGMLQREALAVRRGRKAIAFELIERRNLRSAAALHATSPQEAQALATAAFGPPIVFAPNGVDVAALQSTDPAPTLAQFGLAAGRRFILYMGRVHPIKRLDLLAAAAGQLRARDVRVVVAGPDERGHRAAIAPAFASAGVDVVWTGAVDGRQKADLLASASALVLCSDSESFGLAAAEAMAAGTPVVVTRTCPWPEVEREGAGYWVEHDAAAIAVALDAVLADPDRARTMGQRGRALIAGRYTWDASARVLADSYRRLVVRPAVAHAV